VSGGCSSIVPPTPAGSAQQADLAAHAPPPRSPAAGVTGNYPRTPWRPREWHPIPLLRIDTGVEILLWASMSERIRARARGTS
jgi:hypothetical protein